MKTKILYIPLLILVALLTQSCEEENERVTGGTPEVRYVRPCDVDASDSLLIGAYLGSKIVIIGESLAGVDEIYFNDQKAALNPNLITDNAIVVNIPTGIPSVKQDLIKLYTSTDSCYYTFETKVPVPTVKTMTCEYLDEGDTAHIEGLYFVNDLVSPLKVIFTGGVEAEILNTDINSVEVIVPAGAEAGPVTVSSVYGDGESNFWFRDNRNIIADFNADNYPDYGFYFGWHGAGGVTDVDGVNGNYLVINGENKELTDESWDDAFLSWEKWTYLPTDPDFFDAESIDDYVCKFEVRVFGEWSAKALQVIFTGASDVMLNWQNGNGLTFNETYGGANGYVTYADYPRALWMPWANEEDGSYTLDDWITVSIPMTDFKYGPQGESLAPNGSGHYSGLTLFLWGGGVSGTPCNAKLWIDNVRVVPN